MAAAVACLVVLAIGAAMLFAPVRQAVAEWIREYIIQLDNDGDLVIHPPYGPDEENVVYPSENGPIDVSSIEEFVSATGLEPLVLDLSAFTIESIDVFVGEDTTISVTYSSSDGPVYVTQVWNVSSEMYGYTNSEFTEDTTESGKVIYWSLNEVDHTLGSIFTMGDSIVLVGADETVPVELFLNILDYLTAPQS